MIFQTRFSSCTFLILILSLTACEPGNDTPEQQVDSPQNSTRPKTETPRPVSDSGVLTRPQDNLEMQSQTPEIETYQNLLADVLMRPVPVMTLNDLPALAATQQDLSTIEAENIALANPEFLKFSHHASNQQPLRNEIMTARPALPGDLKGDEPGLCTNTTCYRVQMYNYFYNLTSTAIVDLANKKVLSLNHLNNIQPDLNTRLKQLATAIANNSPDVKAQLGEAGEGISPTMSEIKTALKNSRCERSKHLCVAPTYVVGSRALWAIVDLTDLELVGVRWSDLGSTGPPVMVTERTLENQYVFNKFCEQTNHFKQGAWSFDYNITSSDGMRLAQVNYRNKPVIDDVKLVDWHVSYSQHDNFGYSDAIGCPMFSSAVVVAHDGPSSEDIIEDGEITGFAFIQDFRQLPWPTPCNYRYEQRFEFYHDGRFRIAFADYGRGCGTDGTYRPVTRIELAQNNENPISIAHFENKQWQNWETERWTQQDDLDYFDSQYTHKISTQTGEGFLLAPGNGQFGDEGRGDRAYVYATVAHPDLDEGASDLSTLGSCCNQDYQQGPELFIAPAESLVDQAWVLWYVAQIKNDGAPGSEYCWADTEVINGSPEIKVWPCFAGPMFVPISQ